MARASVRTAAAAAAAIGLLVLASCASNADPNSSQGASARRCFSTNNTRNFRVVDSRTVMVRASGEVFRLDLLGACPNLGWSNSMAFVTNSGSRICTGNALGTSIVVRGTSGRQRCAVQTVTLLTPEQVEALPARHRP